MGLPELRPDVITSFRKGDSQAFASFFHLYYRPLCFFADQLIDDMPEAEDIVKECFVKLWYKHKDFDSAQNIKAFLYISTRNSCLNFLRHLQVRDASRREMIYLESGREEEVVINHLIRTELLTRIYTEIELMPEKRREVFKLAYLEGLKNSEIADQLDISVFTVKEHKGKALQQLRLTFSDKQLVFLLLGASHCLALAGKVA